MAPSRSSVRPPSPCRSCRYRSTATASSSPPATSPRPWAPRSGRGDDVNGPSILHGAGTEGHDVAGLWWVMFALAAAVYVVVGGLVIYSVLRKGRGRFSD